MKRISVNFGRFPCLALIITCPIMLYGCVGSSDNNGTPATTPPTTTVNNSYHSSIRTVPLSSNSEISPPTITKQPDKNYNLLNPDTSIYCKDDSNNCADAINIGSPDNVINLTALHTAPLGYQLSQPQIKDNSNITKVIIVIHGLYGNNNVAFAAVSPNHDINTAIIAPYFGGKETTPPDANTAIWHKSGWIEGGLSENLIDHGKKLSSFKALSKLVDVALYSYPNTKEIVFAGFSAGAQVLQRYALFDMYNEEKLKASGVLVRFVIASPSSYIYLDDKRIKSSLQCNDKKSCNLEINSFEVPTGTEPTCVNVNDKEYYDRYKYGLQGIPAYLEQPKTKLINNYIKANVAYLLNTGDASKETNNYVGVNIPAVDDCPAVLEGPSNDSYRFQRGLVFTKYLHLFYPESIATHKLYIYDGKKDVAQDVTYCSHNEYCVWGSPIGQELLRGNPAIKDTFLQSN